MVDKRRAKFTANKPNKQCRGATGAIILSGIVITKTIQNSNTKGPLYPQ
jgi:hypothetical protein